MELEESSRSRTAGGSHALGGWLAFEARQTFGGRIAQFVGKRTSLLQPRMESDRLQRGLH